MEQEKAQMIIANRILREVFKGLKERNIDSTYSANSITVEGIRFELSEAPSDVQNGVMYLVAPHTQLIPIKEEDINESIDNIINYLDNTATVSKMSFKMNKAENPEFMDDVKSYFQYPLNGRSFISHIEFEWMGNAVEIKLKDAYGSWLEERRRFNELINDLSDARNLEVTYHDKTRCVANVIAKDVVKMKNFESIMDLPQVGVTYTNLTGGSCKIIAVDEPALSEEYRLDNFQITYQMSGGDLVCHKWEVVKNMLEYNGYDYKASTKKSKPVSFSEMVSKQRNKKCDSVKKDFLMDLDKYDDIGYMAEACANEMDSVFDAINSTPSADLEFKCSPDEYYQKLLECKKTIDWLVDNISVWRR